MSSVDQFESIFKSATKVRFNYQEIHIQTVLLVNDCDESGRNHLLKFATRFLRVLESHKNVDWILLNGSDFANIEDLLKGIERHRPDLIVTYRHLHSESWQWPYSLGEHLDVMTQVTDTPVLVLPHPKKEGGIPERLEKTDRVLVITDHLTGDHRIASFGVVFTHKNGTLFLSHLEDEEVFERYMEVISKIPDIDSDLAREKIRERLIKEPKDYIHSFQDYIKAQNKPIHSEALVDLGKHLTEYKTWIEEHEIDLVILNTKEKNQMAMDGTAYSLVVELRDTPLLLL